MAGPPDLLVKVVDGNADLLVGVAGEGTVVDGGTPGAPGAQVASMAGTTAQWTTANPVLGLGVFGVEYDLGTGSVRVKAGNGVDAWSDLVYADDVGIAAAIAAQRTLTELPGWPSIELNTDTAGEIQPHPVFMLPTPNGGITNSAAEASLLTNTLSIPANSLVAEVATPGSTQDCFRFLLNFSVTNSSGADRTCRFELNMGGSSVFEFTTPAMPTSATPRTVIIQGIVRMIDFAGIRASVSGTALVGGLVAGGANLLDPVPLSALIPVVAVSGVVALDVRAQLSTNLVTLSTALGTSSFFERIRGRVF